MQMTHISDDDLDEYALNRLPEPVCGEVAQHLLICSSCQLRLGMIDSLIQSLHLAAETVRAIARGR